MPLVKVSTTLGDIVIRLDAAKAPVSTANFLAYVDSGHYNGTIFHRVIDGFMIQGGGFTPDMQQKPTQKPIRNEWKNGLKNVKGSVAMARLGGNPDSASAQFFINVADNGFLDRPQPDGGAYAVFGAVISGMDAVDRIRLLETGVKRGMDDVPMKTVTIIKAERVSDDQPARKSSGKH